MSTLTERIIIDRPRHLVWVTLADVGTIADWNPGLIGSRRTNSVVGVGAARHCDISRTHSLTEVVTEFEPEERITFRIVETTLPFAAADIRFRLTDHCDGTTQVTVTPTYRLRYGVLGRLLDLSAVRRSYRTGMRGLLTGLKGHLEHHPSGHPATSE